MQEAHCEHTVGEVDDLIGGIVDFKLGQVGAGSIEEWLAGDIAAGAGTSTDWYALTLSQCGYTDLSAYERSLTEYLGSNNIASATSREKYALALCAAGSGNSYIDKNINADDSNALKDGHTYYYKVRAYHTVFGGIEAYSYSSPSKHSREKLIRQAQTWLGFDEKKNGKFKTIVDVYNGYKPLARDVRGEYNEAWCTTFVTASSIKADLVDIMPRERICRYMIDLYSEMGLWVENDAYVPKPGDLILFDWEDNGRGDCTGAPNHIGIVTAVKDGKITDIEGNNNDKYGHPVSYRTVSVNSRYIRGFMTPRFDVENGILFELNRVVDDPEEDVVQDVEVDEEQSRAS